MVPADDPPPASDPDAVADVLAQLRHDLKTPLTIISGRAQLVARAIRRSPTLAEEERRAMLAGLVAVDAAVRHLVAIIETIGQEPTER